MQATAGNVGSCQQLGLVQPELTGHRLILLPYSGYRTIMANPAEADAIAVLQGLFLDLPNVKHSYGGQTW